MSDPLTLEELERWVQFGGEWRLFRDSGDRAVVDLCTCAGELMERRATDDPQLLQFLRAGRTVQNPRRASATR